MELLLGCGANRQKKLIWAGKSEWDELHTLDFNRDHNPDICWDLSRPEPLPIGDNLLDEIHAYEVLEHIGQQGDFKTFFRQWSDYWRILKHGGLFLGTSPDISSPWLWGDPGHTRAVTQACFTFLHQPAYAEQVGKTPMTDYRFCYRADFDLLHSRVNEAGQLEYVLRAVKPARRA